MAAELCIEASNVSVWRRSGHLVLLIVALTFTLIACDVSHLLALGIGIALEIARRWYFTRLARARPALVRANAGGGNELVIERDDRSFRMPQSKISDCWQRLDAEGAHAIVILVTPRALIKIEVADRTSADALSRALGMDATNQLVGTTLTAPPSLPELPLRRRAWRLARGAGIVFASIASLLLLFMSVLQFYPSAWAIVLLVPLPALVLLLQTILVTVRTLTPSRVLVGRDGLLVIAPERREFIGFERVKNVRDGLHSVEVTLTDGDVVSLPLAIRGSLLWGKPHPLDEWVRDVDQVLARRRGLTSQIEAALARFRDAGTDASAETLARLLDRGSRPIPEWRAELARTHADTYRDRRLDADQLLKVLENPRIPLRQRLGAALALVERREDGAPARERKSRVRAAIASSANPRVRIALERAAEGNLDDATYEQALELEAEAQAGALARAACK